MENLPKFAGYVLLFVGLYFTRIQAKRIIYRNQGVRALNFRVLLYALVFAGLGLFLIIRHF